MPRKELPVRKILLAAVAVTVCMLILPLLVLRGADGWDAMGYLILFFLVLYPILAVALGVLAGTDPRALWWLPVGSALLFPPLFWPSVGEVVWELYIYAAIYLGLAFVSAVPTALIKHVAALKRK